MQQFYKKFLKQTFLFTIQTKIVFSEIKDLSKVGLILLHACVYKYIIVHWQTNELNELREKFCHREFNLETSTLENIQLPEKTISYSLSVNPNNAPLYMIEKHI